jgi:hypothetical protein
MPTASSSWMLPVHVGQDHTAPSLWSTSEAISDDETPMLSIAFKAITTHEAILPRATVRRLMIHPKVKGKGQDDKC